MQAWKENSSFYDKIITDKKITNKIPVNKLKKLFDFGYHTKKINIIFDRSLKNNLMNKGKKYTKVKLKFFTKRKIKI